MGKELLMAVDLGTSFVKAGIYNLDSECIALADEEVKSERPASGIFIQHGEELVQSVLRCIRKVTELVGDRAENVEAIAFTGQMAGFMGVDKDWGDVTGWSVPWIPDIHPTRKNRWNRWPTNFWLFQERMHLCFRQNTNGLKMTFRRKRNALPNI